MSAHVPTTPAHYRSELDKLPQTYEEAIRYKVGGLKAAIAGACESSLIGVGSGGSFTVASLLCNLHETFTGRVSRPSTPLEIICNPTLAASSPVFLISAEGKNPDITEALYRARRHSARTVHVLTNRGESPLAQSIAKLSDVSTYLYELAVKDGYLATNSLLLDATLVAKAYEELDNSSKPLPQSLDLLTLGGTPIPEWIGNSADFIRDTASRQSLVIVYSPLLKPIATDLESKLSESALMHCQATDLRSFAHGRHLWLASRPSDISILALIEPSLSYLWTRMSSLIPQSVAHHAMTLSGGTPADLVAGLVAQMHFVGELASLKGLDPGRPTVPAFGREIYYIDLAETIPGPPDSLRAQEQSKYEVLGARWPSPRYKGYIARARDQFVSSLMEHSFRSIVFDYDGTLCSSQRNDAPPSDEILAHLKRLIDGGVIVGIASGRGGSIQECLAEKLPVEVIDRIHFGLYNAGWIGTGAEVPIRSEKTSEFLNHVTRIVRRLKAIGVPIEAIRATPPFQVSVRFKEGLSTDNMWFVIADALRQAGLDIGRMFRSKHSIDILAPGIGKPRLIEHILQTFKIDPYEVLTMGDQGAWPGNDSTLLEHRFSLSVDSPSRRLDCGWKLAPTHKRDVDATLWYLDRIEIEAPGIFRMSMSGQQEG